MEGVNEFIGVYNSSDGLFAGADFVLSDFEYGSGDNAWAFVAGHAPNCEMCIWVVGE